MLETSPVIQGMFFKEHSHLKLIKMISTLIKLFNEDYFERQKSMNKTAQDLRKDLANAEQQLKRVNNQIDDRLLKLAKAHPMAVVVDMNNTQIYALRVVEHWQIIQEYDVDVKLKYIEMIEKWITEQNPYKQTEMF